MVIIVIKIIMAIISVIGFFLDPDSFGNIAFLRSSVRKNNIYWRTFPSTICIIITLFVCGYLIKSVFNQSTVSPGVSTNCKNLPPTAPPPSPISSDNPHSLWDQKSTLSSIEE